METIIIPSITVICYVVGAMVKHLCHKIDNKYIPIINAILGIALAFWMKGFSFDVALVGLVSGWASTGCYEAIRNMSQGGK